MNVTITGPDGRKAVLTAPDGATQEQILQKAQEVKSRWGEFIGGGAATQPSPVENRGRANAEPAPIPAATPQTPASESAKPGTDSTIVDAIKSFGSGAVEGLTGLAGLPGDLQRMGLAALDKGARAFGYEGPEIGKIAEAAPPGLGGLMPSSETMQHFAEKVVGEMHQPQTTAGEYARTAGHFAPAAVGGPGSLAQRALTRVAVPAAFSETAGQVTKGTEIEPYARVAGGIVGAVVPSVAARVASPVRSASNERLAAAERLRQQGVTSITAGQATGSEALRGAESHLSALPGAGGRAAAMREEVGEQYTRAVLRHAGEDAPRATPEVIDHAFTRIGQAFDDVASRTNMPLDRPLMNAIATAQSEYNLLVPASQRAPIIHEIIDDIRGARAGAAGGAGPTLGGRAYMAYRSLLDRAARAARENPELSNALFSLRNALDDALGRGATTADLELLRGARRQYRNLLVVENAVTGAGEQTAAGLISPSQLRAAVKNQNKRAYARGTADLAQLARDGEAVLKPLPQSGTPWRQATEKMMGTLGGAGVAFLAGGNVPAALSMLGTAAAPSVAGRTIMSPLIQMYLRNQAAAGLGRDLSPGRSALLSAALARVGAQ